MSDNNTTLNIKKIIQVLEQATKNMTKPMVSQIVEQYGKDAFLILISCLLSLRSRDSVTHIICKKLFAKAKTPHEILLIPVEQLEDIIKSIGFYRKKANLLHSVSKELIERFNGKVPNTESDLLSISGVGRKTANLVLAEAFDVAAICVDTHVHRISNRLGWVKTKTPEQTEKVLKKIVPQDLWRKVNYYLVMWGQNICVPISPFCSKCAISSLCPKIGVKSSR